MRQVHRAHLQAAAAAGHELQVRIGQADVSAARRARPRLLLLSLVELGWMADSARCWVTERGERLDLLRFPPSQIRMLAERAALARSDVAALAARRREGGWLRPIFWQPLRVAMEGRRTEAWTEHHQSSVRSLVSLNHWPQQRQFDHGISDSYACRACHGAPGTLFHRREGCPAWASQRREQCDPGVLQALRCIRDWGQETELAACAIFPSPLDLAPAPRISPHLE